MEPKSDFYDELHDAVFDAIALAMGKTESEATAIIRYSMPDGESQPFIPLLPDENRCYVRFSSSPLGGVGTREHDYQSGALPVELNKTVSMTDGITASLVFYGKDAVRLAEQVLIGIHEDKARERLRLINVAPVNTGTMPVWVPELVNGNWINRCDLEIRMYRVVAYHGVVEAMLESPEIIIKRER